MHNKTTIFYQLSFCLLILTAINLYLPPTAHGQTEKLGIVSYASPKGWAKTPKENVVGFSRLNQTTGGFCIITLYGATFDGTYTLGEVRGN
jgi:hypothetical protein